MQRLNEVQVTGPTGTVVTPLATCGHCQYQLAIEPSRSAHIIVRIAAPCGGCGKYLCGPCRATGGCDPWEKKMERMEARDRLLRAMGV